MALSLLDMARLALNGGRDQEAAIIAQFASTSPVLQNIVFREIQGNALTWNREETLPTSEFRAYNSGYTESSGTYSTQTVALKVAGGYLDVDRAFLRTAPNSRSEMELAHVKSLSLNWTRTFFKGDSVSNPLEFNGLQWWLGNSSTQVLNAGSTSGGDPLSLAALDEALSLCKGENRHIYANRKMTLLLTAAARNTAVGGFVQYMPQEFGAPIVTYQGVPIHMIEEDASGTEILPFTESNPGGGTPASTSIYVVSHDPMGVVGLQNGGIDVADLGEIDSKPVLRTRVEWMCGLAVMDARAAVRIQGIKNAAIVA